MDHLNIFLLQPKGFEFLIMKREKKSLRLFLMSLENVKLLLRFSDNNKYFLVIEFGIAHIVSHIFKRSVHSISGQMYLSTVAGYQFCLSGLTFLLDIQKRIVIILWSAERKLKWAVARERKSSPDTRCLRAENNL